MSSPSKKVKKWSCNHPDFFSLLLLNMNGNFQMFANTPWKHLWWKKRRGHVMLPFPPQKKQCGPWRIHSDIHSGNSHKLVLNASQSWKAAFYSSVWHPLSMGVKRLNEHLFHQNIHMQLEKYTWLTPSFFTCFIKHWGSTPPPSPLHTSLVEFLK